MNKLTIVSRKSNLAMRQSEIVKQQLQKTHKVDVEIIGISTSGDEILDKSLVAIGGKGLFVNELEQYLLNKKADIAVHSLKDMPAELPTGLAIGAILARDDPRDVFVSKHFNNILELPAGAIVGTSSLRRQAQVLALNHNVIVEPLRGNVETRIAQLLDDKYAAIILAAAGLSRLGLTQWLKNPLEFTTMLPAVGQGAIAVEYRHDDKDVKELLASINDKDTEVCVAAERSLNITLGGSCQAPIAGYAYIENDQITLHAMVALPNGSFVITDMQTASKNKAHQLGIDVASQLIAEGALEIIKNAKQQLQNSW